MAENLPSRPPSYAERALPSGYRPAPAPKHLSREAKTMWRGIVDVWPLAADGLPLLRAALEQWDAYQSARADVVRDGTTVQAEGGMLRAHPSVKTANDALQQFRQCWRQLALDVPPEPAEPGEHTDEDSQ